jgi:hypothetical protein
MPVRIAPGTWKKASENGALMAKAILPSLLRKRHERPRIVSIEA